ncbi:hypothetical protein D187_007027 [Cystobacter fuscus DSM 2262]|uniref:Uncharacterized protein n=1 Tax=Cystobacter fuscus (strain ATCC 25194 / DSM 2262 / NBRC 100088 / M29) TaxID=1242864 RepID=S9QLB1_CYSF2|nr:hypothetical protein D187_007027 [Cystobacter fuscus DSM 2262]
MDPVQYTNFFVEINEALRRFEDELTGDGVWARPGPVFSDALSTRWSA